MRTLDQELADAGGVEAPPSSGARLRGLLAEELQRGMRELGEARTGYGEPIVIAFLPATEALVALCPARPETRADPGAAPDRAWELLAAVVGALVDACAPGELWRAHELALRAGVAEGMLALSFPCAPGGELEAAELAALALSEGVGGIDRLHADAVVLPAHVVPQLEDVRPPLGATHPLSVFEVVARLGGRPQDQASVDALEDRVLTVLVPEATGYTTAHEDPDPARRVARRIVQRLDGMGKWGGYHTAFDHLARGFAGNERALANEVGDRLVEAGILLEKPSVGQRHVFLNPKRSGDIRALIDRGEVPAGLRLPAP
jgi:hypothetical protein